MRVELQQVQFLLAFLRVDGGNQHATGLNAHHGTRRQVDDGHERLADELFRLVEGMDAGKDRAIRARAIIEGELQELLALLDSNAVFDFDGAEVALAERIEVDHILVERLDLDLREVNLLRYSSCRCLSQRCRRPERFHRREQQDIANRSSIGQQHDKTVDAVKY